MTADIVRHSKDDTCSLACVSVGTVAQGISRMEESIMKGCRMEGTRRRKPDTTITNVTPEMGTRTCLA